MRVRVGFSADPDDAFMYWGISAGAVDRRGFDFEPVTADIQTLNEWALEGRLEVTALSAAAYPLVQERYLLLPHGASLGSGYGPVVVAREPLSLDELRAEEIVVPGALTTAYLVLRMALGAEQRVRALAFDRILAEVVEGRAAAGLLIHEGQLTYRDHGLEKCLDLGEWWLLETGLPLPLGVNTIRRDLGEDAVRDVSAVLRDSIEASLAHRDEALAYALGFGRGLDGERGDRFVGMYVNELTRDYGDEGRAAVRELYERAGPTGAYAEPVRVEFAP
ncbi:MAG TPA: MqnA/MqnD/SBP family protein [Gaiellaceae bacterium]|nr:MqnA/MqnD/SBP family protein [Gaiellaceae bacterium]